MESLIRAILALVALAVFVAITFVEQNLVFLLCGAVFAGLFLGLGRGGHGRRGAGGDSGGAGGDGGWFGDWSDGGGDGSGDGGGGGD